MQEEDHSPLRNATVENATMENDYIRGILNSVDLHILQRGLVNKAFTSANPEVDLFHLFLTKDNLDRVAEWTNELLH